MPGCLDRSRGVLNFIFFSFALSHNSLELRLLGDNWGIFLCCSCHLEEPGGAELHLANTTANTPAWVVSQRCHFQQPQAHLQWTVWFISSFFLIHTPSRGSINAERIKDVESWLLKGCIHWKRNISEDCVCWGSDIQSRLWWRAS